ncbi:unnamed protein product [Prunus armeniaca]|uniref:Uncharacterized protein n=1 Tax=Prunus armeniaca TaxID=36596 RepID=A0A6J5VNL5_PRUAR|nr:unnamed protein product [Prunus armeniaca]
MVGIIWNLIRRQSFGQIWDFTNQTVVSLLYEPNYTKHIVSLKKTPHISIRRCSRKTKAESGLGLLLREELVIDGAEQSLHRMATIAAAPVAGVNKFRSSVEFRRYGGQLTTFAPT